MSVNKQILIIKLFNRLLSKGYSLVEVINLMGSSFPKLSIKMLKLINSGFTLSQIFKKCQFKTFVYESIKIGEVSNQTHEVIELIESNFDFYLKLKNQFNKVLLYPTLLFVFSSFSFELIRINLYPIISSLLNDFAMKENHLLLFFAFHLLKIIGGFSFIIFIVFYLINPLSNIIPYIKSYRSLYIAKTFIILLRCGFSLEESITMLKENLNSKIYQLDQFYKNVIEDDKNKSMSPYTKTFINYFKVGLNSNDLLAALIDYQDIYFEVLLDKLQKLSYYLQFILFSVLSINIFFIYYVMMIPMLKLSNQI